MGNNEAIIYDLEFTTWPEAYTRQWSKSNESREIIRI